MDKLTKNSVVQINDNGPEGWRGCFVQVSEVKTWGIQGWIQIPEGGPAVLRLIFEQFDYIGTATMAPEESDN